MASQSVAVRLLAAALFLALSLVGLDVVDSARTVVVVGGYAWFATCVATALLLVAGALRSRRAHHR